MKNSEPTAILDNLVLIGPPGVGKSTTAQALAGRLNRRYVSLDYERFRYYDEIGYDRVHADDLRRTDFEALLMYYEPYNAHAVRRVMDEFTGAVLDFGAIHSVYDDPNLFLQVAGALSTARHVFLLLPCSDVDHSVNFLIDRGRAGALLEPAYEAMWRRVIRRFLERPDNGRLANTTIFIKGKTPHDIVHDVILALK